MKRIIHVFGFVFVLGILSPVSPQMIANITEDVTTEFGTYHPLVLEFTPNVPMYSVSADFSNVTNYWQFDHLFNAEDSALLYQNHFVVKKSCYKQLFDIYNACTWDGTPLFVTTDAVLHTYHVLFDHLLAEIEQTQFAAELEDMTDALIAETANVLESTESADTQEAMLRNLAFFYVAKKLMDENTLIPDSVADMVNAEINLIEDHEGYQYSPILGNFSALDYSQFKLRGHYTQNDTLKAYFKAMMWYGWTIFTMEPEKFPDLAARHTLQALMMVQMVYSLETNGVQLLDIWDKIYDTTVFFVGKTDDPNIRHYKQIGEQVYGANFLDLPPDSLANAALLSQLMTEAQKLPEPKIPNWIYGTFVTYKGFRFMGQRFIPDSYLFAHLIRPFVDQRTMPMGLDVMTVLGSDRAYTIADSVYHQTGYAGYAAKISEFKTEFQSYPAQQWAENIYWNWLYCLMPLLYQKGEGYPYFMQTLAWQDKELLTALASWAELRHDTILYAKQSSTPWGTTPDPPKNYVEPNPHLYGRLLSLVRYTRDGLNAESLLLPPFDEKIDLFEDLLEFLLHISIKELENEPLTMDESDNIYCFGKVMMHLVSDSVDPNDSWNYNADDMAVVADVHTDSKKDLCLEEGVGYPLEIFVIVNESGNIHLTRGAIFSYYEFTQPIAERLSDEEWRDMLVNQTAPDLPTWFDSFMNPKEEHPGFDPMIPGNLFHGNFTDVEFDEQESVPEKTCLLKNYPNPFNSMTTIQYRLSSNSYVTFEIYNVLGQKIATLEMGKMTAGKHQLQWDGTNDPGHELPSGIYLCKIVTDDFLHIQKMYLIR